MMVMVVVRCDAEGGGARWGGGGAVRVLVKVPAKREGENRE